MGLGEQNEIFIPHRVYKIISSMVFHRLGLEKLILSIHCHFKQIKNYMSKPKIFTHASVKLEPDYPREASFAPNGQRFQSIYGFDYNALSMVNIII